MSMNPRQALVGDIGGTFISLAITDIDELTISNFALLSSGDFSTPVDAIERYLKSVPGRPGMASLAVAGTVEGDSVHMTHHPWTFTRPEIAALTGAQHVVFTSDLEALALSLPHLTAYDLIEVGKVARIPDAPRVVISVGTSLGVAALVRAGGAWTALPGEGGHMGLPALAEGEFDIHRTHARAGFVSAGDVLSGDGLARLYAALARGGKHEEADLAPPAIIEAGLSGQNTHAAHALELFVTWLGRFAGDLALLYGARGGVYLGGVIAANIAPMIAGGSFREAFEAKGARKAYLKSVPVSVIKTAADAGLRGAAIALAQAVPTPAPAPHLRQPTAT